MFSRSDLTTLVDAAPSPGVSIYLPTHVRGVETQQDPIRLKNLLGEARESLETSGLRPPDIDALLAPATALVDDYEFWQHQDRGLALFLGGEETHRFKVPLSFEAKVVVGPAFHMTPLLPLLAADGAFQVLTITAQSVRLFDASRFSMIEDAADDFPANVAEVSGEAQYQDPAQASPMARPNTGNLNMPNAQVLGDSPEDWRKGNTVEFVRHVASAMKRRLATQRVPVVLIADAEIQGHFQKLGDLGSLLAGVVETNPAAHDVPALHATAYDVVRPLFEAGRQQVIERMAALLGSGDALATLDAGEIVKAAHGGRVETLTLVEGAALHGRWNEATASATMGVAEVGRDMVDAVTAQVLRQGGAVMVLTPDDMPANANAAAVLRY